MNQFKNTYYEHKRSQRRRGYKKIEKETSKSPSDLFLISALTAMGASLTLKLLNKPKTALFVGQWASPFLLLGVYNKLVKQDGHDQQDDDLSEENNNPKSMNKDKDDKDKVNNTNNSDKKNN